MVRGDAGGEPVQPSLVAQRLNVAGVEIRRVGRRDLAHLMLLGSVEERCSLSGERLRRIVAALAGEHEDDHRQPGSRSQMLDDLRAPRPSRSHASPTLATLAARTRTRLFQQALDLGVRAPVPQGRQVDEAAVVPLKDQVAILEGHRPLSGHHCGAVAGGGLDPCCKLVGIADRGRQAHQPHVRRRADDDLFPDGSPVRVLQEVNLIQHSSPELGDVARAGVHHVAQHFGGHDHHIGIRGDHVVAGEQAHPFSPQPGAQLAQLLVRQRLGGRGVGRSLSGLEGRRDGVLGNQRLAR